VHSGGFGASIIHPPEWTPAPPPLSCNSFNESGENHAQSSSLAYSPWNTGWTRKFRFAPVEPPHIPPNALRSAISGLAKRHVLI
jgi:hypothetical protein